MERERLANEDKILEGRDEEGGGVIGGEGGAGTPGLDGSEKGGSAGFTGGRKG